MDGSLNTCGRKRVQTALFVFLLVVNAAAECPKPEGGETIILSDAALLMNDFPEDSEVTLECGHGYETESGSGVITCIDEKWTKPDLTCKKKDCGTPTPLPHMTFDLNQGSLFGAVAKVLCDKGYRISGSSYKQCFASGWSGRAKCEIVTCGKPDNVTNGKSSWDSQDIPKYGETVQYSCDQGFSLTGNDSIMCTETGEYDAKPPKCEGQNISEGFLFVGVTTDDRITTFTPTPATPEQAFRDIMTTVSPDKDTTRRESTVSNRATTLPPSLQGGRGIFTAEDKDTPSVVTSTTSSKDMNDATVEPNMENRYLPIIISVISISLAVCLVLLFVHKFLMRKKGLISGMVPIYSRTSVTPDRRADRL